MKEKLTQSESLTNHDQQNNEMQMILQHQVAEPRALETIDEPQALEPEAEMLPV